MLTWLLFAGLTALALGAVLWPLARAGDGTAAGDRHDEAIYRDQLQEIERDVERGLMAPAEASAARAEIARRLLAAAAERETLPSSPAARRKDATRSAFVFAAACVPLVSLGLYLHYGSPGLPDQPLAARLEAPDQRQEIAALIARVEARLREHPEDGRGWDVIAPVYLRLGRYDDAADAFSRARRLLGDTPERLVGHGEALVLANNGIVTETARLAFEKARAADPTLIKPRFWTAVALEQDGRHGEAAAAYRAMLAEAGQGAPWRNMVEDRLRVAESQMPASPRPEAGSSASERGPSAEDVAAAEAMSEDERAAMIEQMVAGLAQRLRAEGGSVEEWLRLVRAYDVLGRREEALKALAQARLSLGEDALAREKLDAAARRLSP